MIRASEVLRQAGTDTQAAAHQVVAPATHELLSSKDVALLVLVVVSGLLIAWVVLRMVLRETARFSRSLDRDGAVPDDPSASPSIPGLRENGGGVSGSSADRPAEECAHEELAEGGRARRGEDG